jgi:hypothetical protein
MFRRNTCLHVLLSIYLAAAYIKTMHDHCCIGTRSERSTKGAHASIGGSMPLNRRVHWAMERNGMRQALDAITAFLSFCTVMTYIVSTYGIADFNSFDLATACIFAAEWVFRLWKAPSRLDFIFSWWSLLDLVTFVPMLVLAMLSTL